MPISHWNAEIAESLTGVDQLVYRSNLLGNDRTICNWGGGNTSMKVLQQDFRGTDNLVMFVKGSGCDLATMTAKNFTGLRQRDMEPLVHRDVMPDEEMVDYLTHCMVDSKHPRMSIETLLHAFLPHPHVDHTHPDAIISLCCADNGLSLAREIYGDRFVWVPYIRPGFTLSKQIAEAVQANPKCELVLMGKHGLVTWGETSSECYDKTLAVIQEAEDFIDRRRNSSVNALFGGVNYKSLPVDQRKRLATEIMPTIRGCVGKDIPSILRFDDSPDILDFVNSMDAPSLSQVGAACPDHLVHTKRTPLYIKWDPATDGTDKLLETLIAGISRYRSEYIRYFDEYKCSGDIMFDPSPRVILIPGLGMISTGKSADLAEVSGALYHRAISVMAGATALGEFVSLSAGESFAVEYWPLELYKLSLAPPEADFSRRIAFITGGAGGIGSATARQLVKEGAHVVLADLNFEGAQLAAEEINALTKSKRAIAVRMDVTSETAVKEALMAATIEYGGVDVVINNAGLATSSPFDQTSLDEWNLNMNVLSTGYFLVAREAFKIMKTQGTGGSMVFVCSKNSIYAGKNASAYSTAKAAELHLARCIAAEGGEFGIRVNSVMPDAVLAGSAIWNGAWRTERAAAYGIDPDQLEEYYRKRTTLLVNVYPDDIAQTIAFLASKRAAKTTGCLVTVDGGVPAAFAR